MALEKGEKGPEMTGATRVLIVGAGGIGSALGARLTDAGLGVRLVGREPAEAVTRRIVGTDGAEKAYEWPAATAGDWDTAELVMVAVRAIDLEAALASIAARARAAAIWPLANGATEHLVRQVSARPTPSAPSPFRPSALPSTGSTEGETNAEGRKGGDAEGKGLVWRLGFSTFAVSALAPGQFALRSKTGGVHVGPFAPGEKRTAIESELCRDPFFCWHDPIQPHQRKKWLFNTTINTLTAARRLARNGDLLADVPTLAAVYAEARALGESLWGPWPESAQSMYETMVKLIEATAGNENSMARDRRLGRATESRFLAGLARDETKYPLLVRLAREIEPSPSLA